MRTSRAVLLLATLLAVGGALTNDSADADGDAGAGQIYLSDTYNHRLVRMNDMAGAGRITYGTGPGTKVGQFNRPHDLFVSSSGRIYIADTINHRVVRIDDMSGAGWMALGTEGSGVNQFVRPRGIWEMADGKIVIADGCNHRLVRIDDMTGAGWEMKSLPGSALCPDPASPGDYGGPNGIWVDAAGAIHVADIGNHRILRLDDWADTTWEVFGSEGTEINQFKRPHKVAVNGTGQIYITDTGNNRIVRINDMTGTGWTTLGGLDPGAGVGQFYQPNGIWLDGSDHMYVADQRNSRIVKTVEMNTDGWTVYTGSGETALDRPNHVLVAVASCTGTGAYRISGSTKTETGSPVAGVSVGLMGPGGCRAATTTRARGTYQFPSLASGTYLVTPGKEGCTFMPASRTVTITDRNMRVDFIAICP